IGVTRFGALEKEFDFGKSAAGWVKDDAGIWHFAAPEGVTIGNWEIPHDYHNPYTVGLRQVPNQQCTPTCLPVASRGFVEFDWTPGRDQAMQYAGKVPLLVYVDPHDVEPEYEDDLNRYEFSADVLASSFDVQPV